MCPPSARHAPPWPMASCAAVARPIARMAMAATVSLSSRMASGLRQRLAVDGRAKLDIGDLLAAGGDLAGRHADILDVGLGLIEMALQIVHPVAQPLHVADERAHFLLDEV